MDNIDISGMKHINFLVTELHKAARTGTWVSTPENPEATRYLNNCRFGYDLCSDAFMLCGNSLIEEAGNYGRVHGITPDEALTPAFIIERVANVLAYMKMPDSMAEKAEAKGCVFFVEGLT